MRSNTDYATLEDNFLTYELGLSISSITRSPLLQLVEFLRFFIEEVGLEYPICYPDSPAVLPCSSLSDWASGRRIYPWAHDRHEPYIRVTGMK